MRKYVVTCDRCSAPLAYGENHNTIIDGVTFVIPIVLPNGKVGIDGQKVDLCRDCVIELKKFMDFGKFYRPKKGG